LKVVKNKHKNIIKLLLNKGVNIKTNTSDD